MVGVTIQSFELVYFQIYASYFGQIDRSWSSKYSAIKYIIILFHWNSATRASLGFKLKSKQI